MGPPAAHASPQDAPLAEVLDTHHRNRRRLLVVAVFGSAIMLFEVAGGLYADSLVLLADAAHYFTDIGAVLVAYGATAWSMRPASHAKTFGYHRYEVVAAFVNALALWALCGFLVWHAYLRILNPEPVDGLVVIAVGAVTLVGDLALAGVLRRGIHSSINMRAAYLHLVSDVLGSVAAVAAGLLVYFFNLNLADPVLTLVVAALIVVFTFRLTRQTLHILAEGTPRHLDVDEISKTLGQVHGVASVHDLHVWTLTPGLESVSVHVVLDHAPRGDEVAHAVHERLLTDFGLRHATVQIEDPSCPCDQAAHESRKVDAAPSLI